MAEERSFLVLQTVNCCVLGHQDTLPLEINRVLQASPA